MLQSIKRFKILILKGGTVSILKARSLILVFMLFSHFAA
ncbi:MAG: hypothetical protein IIZ39_12865 [Blautia sp.]|nr:hypothetical protein [Blautia sp.]